MREVHPTAHVYVNAGFVGEFVTDCLTPSWRRIPMFGVNSINGSVQWLGVPDFLWTDRPPWAGNLMDPSPSWVNGVTTTNPNWGSQPGGPNGSFAVPSSGTV